jgi:hypothetical protein
MDQQLDTLTVQLADVAIRNTAGSIADRVRAVKARKREAETVAELEEIINDLVADKSELVRIARAYDEEFVAQRISFGDIQYISNNIVPLLQQFIESAAASNGQGAVTQEVIDLIKPILSVETVMVLQLLGFNFRKAIGEPLTEVISKLILSRVQVNPALPLEIQRLTLAVSQDPEAYERLLVIVGKEGQGNSVDGVSG